MIEALIQLNNADYVPEQWHGTLLFWATVVVAVFINTVTSTVLPKIEAFILVVHVIGFFAILIPVVYVSSFDFCYLGDTDSIQLAPNKASAHDVFTQFSNGGAWPTQGLSFFVGLVGNVFAMFGRFCCLDASAIQPANLFLSFQAATVLYMSVFMNSFCCRLR